MLQVMLHFRLLDCNKLHKVMTVILLFRAAVCIITTATMQFTTTTV